MRKVVIFVTTLALLGAGAAVALGAGGPSENGDQIRLQLQDGSCLETTTAVVPETSVPEQTQAQEQIQAQIQDQTREQAQERLQLRDGSCDECPGYGDGVGQAEPGSGTQEQLRAGVQEQLRAGYQGGNG